MIPEAYDRIAALYDLEHAAFLEDLALYRQFAASSGGPILELACGSGRLTLPLAQDGYNITGVDVSAGMLALCRAALAEADPATGARVTLVEAAMDALPDGGAQFGFAFVALGSFNHLAAPNERVAALRAIRRQVKPGALFVLDLAQADLRRFAALAELGTMAHITTFEDPANDILITHTLAVAPYRYPGSFLLTHWYDQYHQDGPLTRIMVETPFAAISWGEILANLGQTGWHPRQWYGDHDLSPYSDGAPRLIVVAQAAE